MLNSSDGQQHEIWLVPAKLNSIRFINDPQSTEGETSEAARAAGGKWSANVLIDEKTSAKTGTDNERYNALAIRINLNITSLTAWEELFLSHCPSYVFSYQSSTIHKKIDVYSCHPLLSTG